MDLSPLPPSLREKVEAHLARRPKTRSFIVEVLKRRAETTNATDREAYDAQILALIAPRSSRWLWLAISLPLLVMGGIALVDHLRHEAMARNGVAVVARVERVTEGFCLVGQTGSRCLDLSLQLWPTDAAPYTATLTHSIESIWFSRVQPGSWITVLVDKDEPQHVGFDERAMQVAAPTPPAAALQATP